MRPTLLAALAVMATAAACSRGDRPTAPTDSRFLGGWTGTTSQQRPFTFLVNTNGVVLAVVYFSVAGTACTDEWEQLISREPPSNPFRVSGARFTISTSGSRGSIELVANLTPEGGATGTLVVNSTHCNGRLEATWTAQKATGAEVNVSGAWAGTAHSNLLEKDTPVAAAFTQSAAAFVGDYAINDAVSGEAGGNVTGWMFSFELVHASASCSGRLLGHGAMVTDPEELVLFYTGQDCLGPQRDGFMLLSPAGGGGGGEGEGEAALQRSAPGARGAAGYDVLPAR